MTIDIRAALDHVAPGAAYGWRGGAWDDYSQVEWRDEAIPQPTLAQLQTAWQEILAEQQQADDTLIAVKNQALSAVGVALTDLTQTQKEALLAVLLWRAGAIDRDATIKPFSEWVNES